MEYCILDRLSFMRFLGSTNLDSTKTVFIPISMLMLFVFSAGFTGFLVFGRPIMWYLDGKKKEATSLLFYTLGILLLLTIVVFLTFFLVV